MLYPFAIKTKWYYEDKSVQSRKIKGKAIIASNHHDLYDVGAIIFTFPFRTPRCLMAELLYKKNPFFTFFIKSLGGIKVDRNSNDLTFINKSLKILEKGGLIEVYPEARLPKPGEETPLPFTTSTVYLALESGAPIIPIYNNGVYFKKERNRIIIGKPFNAADYYDASLSETENIENITRILRDKIIELGNELERQQKETSQTT